MHFWFNNLTYIILILMLLTTSINSYTLSSTNCPQYCTCDLTTITLTIACTQPQTTTTFQLPSNFTSDPDLLNVKTILAKNSFIQSFPSNICDYPKVTLLDLSNNFLSNNLTQQNFMCLKNLITLRLANNNITYVNSDAFLNLTSLQALDLSYNLIRQIPQYLFYKHLTQLKSIDLTRNYLTEMELWPLYLPSIVSVDLRYNYIQKFTNKFGWYFIYDSNLPSISSIATINLQFNAISAFDDNTIQQYGICGYDDYATFVNKYFNVFWLNNNPIMCSCFTSQRLVTDSISLLAANRFSIYTNLYESFCSSTSSYPSKRLLNFDTNCAALTGTSSVGYPYCVNGTTTTTTTTKPLSSNAATITKSTTSFEEPLITSVSVNFQNKIALIVYLITLAFVLKP